MGPPPLPGRPPRPGRGAPGDDVVQSARELGLDRWPDVLRDLESGRGLAAHARLRRLRREALGEGERARIDAALADARLFAEPVRKAPALQRVNGVGTTMAGGGDRSDTDGSYLKTRWLSVLWIPILPLDRWVVRDAQGGGWYFLGRVPLDRDARLVRTAVAAVGALGAVVALVAMWSAATHSDVQFLNGLDVPAEVQVDDQEPVALAAQSRVTRNLTSGKHRFRCVVLGRVVDERTEDVPGATALVAYNVAGSAPLYVEDVKYSKRNLLPTAADLAKEPLYDCLAGQVFVRSKRVDYVFRDAPASIQSQSSDESLVKTRADVLDGGWRTAIAMTAGKRPAHAVTELAEAVTAATPDDAATVESAMQWDALIAKPEDHAAMCERLVRLAPASAPLRRALQDARIAAGQDDRAREEAESAYREDPSPVAAVMLARVVPIERAVPLADEAVRKAGSDPYVREIAARVHARARRFDDAAADAAFLLAAARDPASPFPVQSVRLLALAGRTTDALDVIHAALLQEARPLGQRGFLLGMYARLFAAAGDGAGARTTPAEHKDRIVSVARARAAGASPPSKFQSAETQERVAALVRDRADRELNGEFLVSCAVAARDAESLEMLARTTPADDLRAARLALAAWRDVTAAANANAPVVAADLGRMDVPLRVVFAGELARAGRADEARIVVGELPQWLRRMFPDASCATLPAPAGWRERLDPTLQAALLLAHALRTEDGAARETLLDEARSLDPLGELRAW